MHLNLCSSQVEEIHLNYTRFLDKDALEWHVFIDFHLCYPSLQVEEIHLNYTRFLDKDNGRVWWPNRVLRDTPFINLSASGGCRLLPL